MKRILTFFVCVFILLLGNRMKAQETASPKADTLQTFIDSMVYCPLMIIPSNPKYYISDADRDIVKGSKMDFDQVQEKLRNGVAQVLSRKIKDPVAPIALLTYKDTAHDLPKIYVSAVCREKTLPASRNNEKKSFFVKTNAPVSKKTVLKNGQLVTVEESGEKFMDVEIVNKDLIPFLHDKYSSTLFVFINQLEISSDLSDYAAVMNREYQRKIKVHYSIVNSKGKTLYGGISQNNFPGSVNQVDEIVEDYLPAVCDDILTHIPASVPEKRRFKKTITVDTKIPEAQD